MKIILDFCLDINRNTGKKMIHNNYLIMAQYAFT